MEEEDDNSIQVEVEDHGGALRAVVVYDCPECGQLTRFSARDEVDGELRCPCGSVVIVEDGGLAAVQRKLDQLNQAIDNL